MSGTKMAKPIAWDARASYYSLEAHDRPAPPLYAPCITFGFSLRPLEKQDPMLGKTPKDRRKLRRDWVDKVNAVLARFEDRRFRPEGAVPAGELDLIHGAGADTQEGDTLEERFLLGSKNLRIRWTKDGWTLPGYVVIDQQHEHTSFLFTLSLSERDKPRMADGSTLPDLPSVDLAPAGSLPQKLREALRSLAQPAPEGATDEEMERLLKLHTDCAVDEVWAAFLEDLCQVTPPKPAPHDADEGELFPGEAFAALKNVVVREDEAWLGDDPRFTAIDCYDKPSVSAQAFDALEKRRAVFRQFFPDGRNREAIGSLAMGCQALLVSTLGSTQIESILDRGVARLSGKEVEPTRSFLLLKGRPDAPQLGRMIERLHALETLRIAAVIDVDDLRDVSVELRHLGAQLDHLMSLEARDASDDLSALLKRLSQLGVRVRGGLSYRLSQAKLYADTFERRLLELGETPVETWQPYKIFADRRLQDSFDFIQEIEERRDFLFTRAQLLLQRNIERETFQTLESTDRISNIAALAAPTGLGLAAHESVTYYLPEIVSPSNQLMELSVIAASQFNGGLYGLIVGAFFYTILKIGQWVKRG